MSFYKKYELDRLMADGDAKTFRAVENATGRVVFLHLFNPSGQPLLAALKSRLGGVRGKPVPPLIELGEFAGSPYAVTQAIEPFGNLRDWVAQHATAPNSLLEDSSPSLAAPTEISLTKPPQPPPSTPLVADPALPVRAPAGPPPISTPPPSASAGGLVTDGAGEFTRVFQEPPRVAPPSGLVADHALPVRAATEPPSIPPPPPHAPAAGLVTDGAGEFTRLFHEPFAVPPPPPHAPAGGLVADSAGEFTRLFHEPPRVVPPSGLVADPALPIRAAAAPPSIPTPPPSASAGGLVADGAGEFTRLFHEPPAVSAPPPHAPAGGLVTGGAGEFTRLFHEPPAVPAPPPPPVATGGAGEFTRQFHDTPAVSAPPPHAPPGAPEADVPGAFTRLFQVPLGESASRPDAPQPSEFTRLFHAPPAGPVAPPHLPDASSDAGSAETGQFTRLFGSRLPGEAIDIEKEHASAAGSAAPENRPFQQAGEFTRMFGPQPGATGSPTPAHEGAPLSLNTSTRLPSASGMFGTPEEVAKVAAGALAGPGEYTRVFDSPTKPEDAGQPASPAPPPAPPPESAPRKSYRDTIVIVVSIVVLVSLIVMAIVLRKH